jgi:hypothetical protein
MGFPSTCSNGNAKEIVSSALNLINIANKSQPDCVLVEFGDAVLGEYHVADILKNNIFKSQIGAIVLAANDLAGIKGTIDILAKWGLRVDIITGPIGNSRIGVELIKKHFKTLAESNQHDIPETVNYINNKLFQKI